MSDTYGWTNNGRQVFDADLLEGAAKKLRTDNTAQQLTDMLLDALAPPLAFGQVRGAQEASDRLKTAYDSMKAELDRVGIDLSDLASRALAAADLARGADPATQAAARRGHTRCI